MRKISVMGGTQSQGIGDYYCKWIEKELKGVPTEALQVIADILKLPSSQWQDEMGKIEGRQSRTSD